MASQTAGIRLFVRWLVRPNIKVNKKAPHNWPFVRRIHEWPLDKRQVARGRLPCHDDIIQNIYVISNRYVAKKTALFSLMTLKCGTLLWRHTGRDGVSNHQPRDCLLNLSFRRRSRKTSKLRVTGLCEGNLPVTGEFPAQWPSSAENVSIRWRHHGKSLHFSYIRGSVKQCQAKIISLV